MTCMAFFKRRIKEKEKEKDWYLSDYVKEHWKEIHLDLLKRSVDQAEKYLQETIRTSEIITARSYQIFGLLIPSVTLVLGYCTKIDFSDTKDDIFELSGLLTLLILGFSLNYCRKAMVPYRFHMVGNKPKDSLDERFISNKEPLQSFLINECENYQKRIEKNAENNELRATYIKRSILILLFIPLSLFASWIGFLILSWIK